MSDLRIAMRYAKAIFHLAEEAGVAATVNAELASLAALVRTNPDLESFLSHAGLAPAEQQAGIKALFGGRVSPLVARFLDFLCVRRRLALLAEIGDAFGERYRSANRILRAELAVPHELRADQLAALQQKLETKYGQQIEMKVKRDPTLLGGFIVRVHDVVHDLSVRGRLDALYTALAHA